MTDLSAFTRPTIQYQLRSKQFAQLRINPRILPSKVNPSYLNDQFQDQLILHPNQQFSKAYLSPNSKMHRMLANHDPGSGKTNLAIATALQHAKVYQQLYQMHPEGQSPSIWFIGFSRSAFLRELMRRPEFGFVSRAELAELDRLRKLSIGGEKDREAYQEYESRLKRRLTRKQNGGFFKFFGYKEFYNRLFMGTASTELDLQGVLNGIKDGSIKINIELIDSMRNGFVVCDEIHNAYNSAEINNYGLALILAVSFFDIPELLSEYVNLDPERLALYKTSTIYLLVMTATIANNSPAEVVDLFNLLVPITRIIELLKKWKWYDSSKFPVLNRDHFFKNRRDLQPGSLEKISELVTGLVSRYQDYNPAYYPRLVIEGEPIPIPKDILDTRIASYKGTELPYLKFIRCDMSALHYDTYKKQESLPPDGQALLDLSVPDPANPKSGIFRTKDIKIAYKDVSYGGLTLEDGTLAGPGLKSPNLAKFSSKDNQMVIDLWENLKTDGGKVFISHQYVHVSGALFIANVLRANGFIDASSSPHEHTMCSICGHIMKGHNQQHDFQPARFVLTHGEMDQSEIENSWNKYRSPDNKMGYYYRVLIGSRKMNESVDLNEVRTEMVVHVPDDIPVLIQIIGRIRRRKSHTRLPVELQEARIRIYVSSVPGRARLSYEENRYHEKLQEYLVIQEVEKAINSNAVDAPIQRPVIFPPEANGVIDKKKYMKASLGALYYEPLSYLEELDRWMQKLKDPKQTDQSTYAYFAKEELALQIHMIKRLFAEQSPALSYKQLWELMRNPPFYLPLNPLLLDEGLFRIALQTLINGSSANLLITDRFDPSRFFNSNDFQIVVDGVEHKLICRDHNKQESPIFIITPIQRVGQSLYTDLGKPLSQLSGIPNLSQDQWYRRDAISRGPLLLDISEALQSAQYNYPNMRLKFAQQFSNVPIAQLIVSTEAYDMNFHVRFIQEAIQYAFTILTQPESAMSEFHELYFKMLYFYDKLELVVFANHLIDTEYYDMYKLYVSEGVVEIPGLSKEEQLWVKEGNRYNPFLITSLTKASPKFHLDRLAKFLEAKNIKLDKKTSVKIQKVYPYMLPVGHFLGDPPGAKLYSPTDQTWQHVNLLQPTINQVENNILIGYYELPSNSLEVRFKIRAPIQSLTRNVDTRTLETGSACNTHKKEEILEMMRKLKIKPDSSGKARLLCEQIKSHLMEQDLLANRQYQHLSEADKKVKPRVRWFYLHFEQQPELRHMRT